MKRRERSHLAHDSAQVPRISPLVLMISLSVVFIKQIAFQLIFHSLFSNSDVKRSYLLSSESLFVVNEQNQLDATITGY